ncbi:cullin 1, putative [Acanthamoeba castellanii str. Neff]|uniref:Cullin-5 n=1 Tax=Acanthamoeba castellanii (strain ATCC 30010 / Neff) TaxID=1257118 RepID=L8HJK9_ACACF|nr:cullin 1, putative [Acanthamoeba castellanii str. Neff]ELR25392.1 cullin 1, putative [Acanthamoeba castellanii str. Neff]
MSLSPQKVDFEKIWNGLQEGVANIITLTGVKGMPMIEDIYKLCTATPQPYSEELYLRLRAFLERHVGALRDDMLEGQGDLLADYLKKWEAYSTGSEYCHHIFRYLNNNWIRKRLEDSRNKLGGFSAGPSSSTEVYEVFTLALVIWKDHVFSKVKDRLVRSLLELITKERDGELINERVVAGVIQSFVKLGSINKNKPLEIYKDFFEGPFLEDTRDYYARESGAFISTNGVSSYMKKAKERLEEEAGRGKKYLDSSSFEKLKRECDTALIERHKDLMQVECKTYLADDKRDDLSRMYHLLSRIPEGINPMLEVLQKYVTDVGFDAVKSIPEASTKTLLDVYVKFSDVVKTAFENDSAFVASLDKAMRQVVNDNPINKRTTKSPELLAKYSDFILSKSNKTFEDDKLDQMLNQVLTIFKYVDDKDVFQKFYSKMLARRLIHGTSLSDDAESAMIGGLKQACGYEYTSKLQRMFNDMALSNDINEKFKEYLEIKSLSNGLDFNILILTAGSWPLTAQSATFNVPQELERCVNNFTGYYNSQYTGRKVNWLHHLSKGDLKTFYLKKRYEFQVTNYQMGVLLMFNKAERLTVEEISSSTNLKDRELTRTLQSLVSSKILRKEPDGATCEPTDAVTLNDRFASKRLRFKPAAVLQKETKEENSETHKSIEEDRKLFLQAAIVRIMKARKTLTHVNLVKETISQAKARFQPSIPMIKKCIEHLIEKEYLQRQEGETNTYSYVA